MNLTRGSPARVLHVVSAMNRGGAETLLMNVYRQLDRRTVQFDFVSHRQEACDYDEEIEALGGKVYRIQSLGEQGFFSYIRQLRRIMRQESYVAVHAHTDYQVGMPTIAARLCGIHRRICHAHTDHWPLGDGWKQRTLLLSLQGLIKLFATDCCACSEEAARFLFGRAKVRSGAVRVLKNAIDVERYITRIEENRLAVRKEWRLPADTKIIGHIGHLSKVKNHMLMLKVMERLLAEDEHIYAIFVGDGPLRKEIEHEARRLRIHEHLLFLGVRADIPRILKGLDVFLFPSFHEGFGMAAVEAQGAGVPVIASDRVPTSTDIGLGLISYVGLDEDIGIWVRAIKNAFHVNRPDTKEIHDRFLKQGYDIHEALPNWLALYGLPS
ncbi:glycosyltransferase family 1 protein [Camelliibacillus cellulosilyticus]|uniref:Glycosyltransferase family 1 protein n=1 Tax=Camelliibacillus cellulosilyticus TaxID=2174486 RepID=A0ABV9GSY4_9BACL